MTIFKTHAEAGLPVTFQTTQIQENFMRNLLSKAAIGAAIMVIMPTGAMAQDDNPVTSVVDDLTTAISAASAGARWAERLSPDGVVAGHIEHDADGHMSCLLYTSPSPRD